MSETRVPSQCQRGGDKVNRQDNGKIPGENGLIAQPPEARPGKDLLKDHRAANQARQQKAEHRHKRQQGVPQGVAVDHALFGQPLSPRGAHIVLAHHFEHLRANVAGQDGNAGNRRHHGWHDQMPQPVHPAKGRLGVVHTKGAHADDGDVKEVDGPTE